MTISSVFHCRLRTRFLHDLIMPQDEYSPLKELVLFPRLDVVVTLADICHTDRVPLASSLLRIFRFVLFLRCLLIYTCFKVRQKRGRPSNPIVSTGDRARGGDVHPIPCCLTHHHADGWLHEECLWGFPAYRSFPNYSQVSRRNFPWPFNFT